MNLIVILYMFSTKVRYEFTHGPNCPFAFDDPCSVSRNNGSFAGLQRISVCSLAILWKVNQYRWVDFFVWNLGPPSSNWCFVSVLSFSTEYLVAQSIIGSWYMVHCCCHYCCLKRMYHLQMSTLVHFKTKSLLAHFPFH